MILSTEPENGLMIAFNKDFHSIDFPKFSDFKIEDGHITLQVAFEPRRFESEDILWHWNDAENRKEKSAPFPFKFEYFDSSPETKNFRITANELNEWRDCAHRAFKQIFPSTNADEPAQWGKTKVNLSLLATLTQACRAAEYYKTEHQQDIVKADPAHMPSNARWRYSTIEIQ